MEVFMEVIDKYVEYLKPIYGSKLQKVILFGSCARGDNTPSSDVDIMILVDIPREDISGYDEELCRMTYDFDEEHGTDISPITQNNDFFHKWEKANPFYANVKKEGVVLYGA